MKFMKLIFVDRTDEERPSLPLSEFYDTGKRICEQEVGVQLLHETPQTLIQDNPWARHQDIDEYQLLIFDVMSRSEQPLNVTRTKLKNLGKTSGWELEKYHVSNIFEDTIYANTLPDDWFKKQVGYNSRRTRSLKIPAAAFYFARISRSIHQIAKAFDVTEWAVRRWAKTPEWQKALDVFGYTGYRHFESRPKRDIARDNRKIFDTAKQAYQEALNAGVPQHKLATIASERVGIPRRRIHDWAMKYGWRQAFAATTYPFEKLREAIRRPETAHPQLAAAEGGYIDRILEVIERFKDQLHAQGRHDEYRRVNETLKELEYPLRELRKYFREDSETHIQKQDAEIFISHLQNQVKEWKRWDLTE